MDLITYALLKRQIAECEANIEATIPHIGENGNWYVGDEDTGKPSRGDKGPDGKSAYQYAVEGGYTGTEAEFAEKLAPLVGTTQTVTPSQVLAAIEEGRDIALQYRDLKHGTFVFGSFSADKTLGMVLSNSIGARGKGEMGTLGGTVDNDKWVFRVTKPATKDDVGTAVNEALAAAKKSGEFDGKSAYQYAVDGGYAGTEAEFAAKLAQNVYSKDEVDAALGAYITDVAALVGGDA